MRPPSPVDFMLASGGVTYRRRMLPRPIAGSPNTEGRPVRPGRIWHHGGQDRTWSKSPYRSLYKEKWTKFMPLPTRRPRPSHRRRAGRSGRRARFEVMAGGAPRAAGGFLAELRAAGGGKGRLSAETGQIPHGLGVAEKLLPLLKNLERLLKFTP